MNEGNPLVSVIIPTYNRVEVLPRAINSVLNQTYKNIDIVLVDDGSIDNTQDVIEKKYDTAVKYVKQPNKGAGAARNLGFQKSEGKYTNFLDSDDYFSTRNIEEKVEVLERRRDIGWVFSDRYYLDSENRIFYDRIPYLEKHKASMLKTNDFFEVMLLSGGKPVQTGTVLMRRECVERIGGWDENLPALQDVDFFLRMSKEFKGKFIDKVGLVQIKSADSFSATPMIRSDGTAQLVEKINREMAPYIRKRKLCWKWRKWQANFFNTYGLELLLVNETKASMALFKKSIRIYPFQKRVYQLMIKTLIQKRQAAR